MSNILMEVEGLSKEYRLGLIGGGTLRGDLQSWFAKRRGLEDPNKKIGAISMSQNERFLALDDVSFQVHRGDALGIIGRNAAGKSTLLKVISRITAPTTGEIRIKGRVASLLEVGTGFHPELTGRENVYLNGAIQGMGRAETTRKLDEIIEFSEVSQFIDTPVKRYSSGMYVKLAFAVAAHLDPDILICDEVLAVGDLAFQQKCIAKMEEIASRDCAVLYVSHSMSTISSLCNRAIFLERGKLLYDGDTSSAIDLYTGAGERSATRDLDGMVRGKDRGFVARMLALDIVDSNVLEYQMDDYMEFVLTARSSIDISRLHLRLIIKNNSMMPIGMSQSGPVSVNKDEAFKMHLRLPLTGLAPSEYNIKLSLADEHPNGRTFIYDTLEDAGRFVITDDINRNDGLKWNEPIWGNLKLHPLEWVDEK